MSRELTSEEASKVMKRAKPAIARPYVYDSTSGELKQISKDFETFLILAPQEAKAKLAQYITTLLSFDLNNLPIQSKLLSIWIDDEINDITKEIHGYQDILDSYDEVIPAISPAKQGFEDVEEVNNLLNSFNKITGSFGEQRDALAFDKAAASVLSLRESGDLSEPLKRELQSYSKVLLSY
jgi:hypothetical protein